MIDLSDEPMTWVMTGDSITQAVLHTLGLGELTEL